MFIVAEIFGENFPSILSEIFVFCSPGIFFSVWNEFWKTFSNTSVCLTMFVSQTIEWMIFKKKTVFGQVFTRMRNKWIPKRVLESSSRGDMRNKFYRKQENLNIFPSKLYNNILIFPYHFRQIHWFLWYVECSSFQQSCFDESSICGAKITLTVSLTEV